MSLRSNVSSANDRGPHVVYVVDRYPVLSQTFVSGEVRELRRQGVRVTVVGLHPGDTDTAMPDLVLDDLLRARWRLGLSHLKWLLTHPVRYGRFRRRLAQVRSETRPGGKTFDWRLLPDLASALAPTEPRLVHAHFAWAGAAAAHCLAALLGIPWTLTVHANDIFSMTQNLDAKLRGCQRLVTVCEYNVRFLREQLGVTRPIDVIVCGVEVPPDGAAQKETDVVAVGRLVPKKGFDTLLRAVAEIPAPQRPTAELIGEGEERGRLESLLDELGLRPHVALRGALSHEQTLARIERARVLCLPARVAEDGDRDSMPVVVKEALARRVPVIASAVVAIPEMVNEEVGRLTEPDDPSQLARAIMSVLSLPEDARERLGRAGRDRVLEHYTLSGETARLRELFLEVAEQRP